MTGFVGRSAHVAPLICAWLLLSAAQAPSDAMFQGFDVLVTQRAMVAGGEGERRLA